MRDLVGMWGGGHCGMEMNKKSGGGDVRAEALSWDNEWDKARKLVFSFISTLAHGGLLRTPLTSLVSRRKSRFAEKKSASPKKNAPTANNGASCVSRVPCPHLWWLATTDPLRGSLLRLRLSPSCARLRLACIELSTIRHLRWLVYLSRRFDKFDKFVT